VVAPRGAVLSRWYLDGRASTRLGVEAGPVLTQVWGGNVPAVGDAADGSGGAGNIRFLRAS